MAELKDEKGNGELIQTSPVDSTNSGSVAGVVLYNEGFIFLTGSWNLHKDTTHAELYDGTVTSYSPTWQYFGTTGSSVLDTNVASSSFSLNFSGTNYINTVTMMAHASRGELNHSNNPTYLKSGQSNWLTPQTSSTSYIESDTIQIKNIVSSSYAEPTGSFQKTTYISKIGIYDKDKNLIAIAKLASPLKKTPNRDFTFKLKLDL